MLEEGEGDGHLHTHHFHLRFVLRYTDLIMCIDGGSHLVELSTGGHLLPFQSPLLLSICFTYFKFHFEQWTVRNSGLSSLMILLLADHRHRCGQAH